MQVALVRLPPPAVRPSRRRGPGRAAVAAGSPPHMVLRQLLRVRVPRGRPARRPRGGREARCARTVGDRSGRARPRRLRDRARPGGASGDERCAARLYVGQRDARAVVPAAPSPRRTASGTCSPTSTSCRRSTAGCPGSACNRRGAGELPRGRPRARATARRCDPGSRRGSPRPASTSRADPVRILTFPRVVRLRVQSDLGLVLPRAPTTTCGRSSTRSRTPSGNGTTTSCRSPPAT